MQAHSGRQSPPRDRPSRRPCGDRRKNASVPVEVRVLLEYSSLDLEEYRSQYPEELRAFLETSVQLRAYQSEAECLVRSVRCPEAEPCRRVHRRPLAPLDPLPSHLLLLLDLEALVNLPSREPALLTRREDRRLPSLQRCRWQR